MAVRIDAQAFRDSISEAVSEDALRLRSDGSVGEVESAGGGAQAVVRDQDSAFRPWVGIVDRDFVADCDCGRVGEDMCPHGVAVALAALEAGITFSAEGIPPGTVLGEPERADYFRAVQQLAPRQLTDLIVEHAVRDRLFATKLLGEAGMLDPADQAGLAEFRAVIREASKATDGRWQISDVEDAGHRLAAEVDVLCARPATPAMLDLVEEAIEVWDELSGYLIDAYDDSRTEPEEISEPLVNAHRDLCDRLRLEPGEIAGRLTRLTDRCDHDTIDMSAYAHLLGNHAGTIS